MISSGITEAAVEGVALAWLESEAWAIAYGPDLERDHTQGILQDRLRDSLARLNPDLPDDALDSALP